MPSLRAHQEAADDGTGFVGYIETDGVRLWTTSRGYRTEALAKEAAQRTMVNAMQVLFSRHEYVPG